MNQQSDAVFQELYKKLNAAQKKAVDAIEGPVMVIAGPGTGKTSILTLRIANILKQTDTRPEQILALTFTESGVQSMRAKLINIMGAEAYKINLFTFHSFANMLIKRYPDAFPRIISSDNASEVDKVEIVESIIDDNSFEYLRPYGDPHYYVSSLIDAIKHLKRERVSIGEFEEMVSRREKAFAAVDDLYYESGAHKGKMKGKYKDEEKQIAKNRELLFVYKKYEEALADRKLYDFEDMLLELIKAMKGNNDFLLSLQEEYQYVLADEHQDANNSQNTILELISSFHASPNLFVVGDEKQAIFRFQGASLENFLYFKKIYPDVTLINLEDNYRSTQSILDASHSLIEKNESGADLRVKLKAHSSHVSAPMILAELSSEDAEKAYVCNEVRKLIQEGVAPGEIAVLFRKNKESDDLGRAFAEAGIPYVLFSDKDMLQDHDIKKLLMILEAINNPIQDARLAEILFFEVFGLSITSVYEALRESASKRMPLFSVLQGRSEFKDFIKEILSLSSSAKNEDLLSFFEVFLTDTNYNSRLLKNRHPLSSLASFEAFLNEVRNYAHSHRGHKLEDFLRHLKKMEAYRIRIKAGDVKSSPDKVVIMTAHKSKGLEFEYVFVTGATDSTWGNTRDMKKFDLPFASSSHIDDDRRLFYVALTRAKKRVMISWGLLSKDKKPMLPSQFILEIDPELTDKADASSFEKEFEKNSLATSFVSAQESFFDIEYLRRIFLSEHFSVTALNNFLSCPWKYYFNNLVRLPAFQTKHQLYGTSIHDTFTIYFNSLRDEVKLSKEEVLAVFEKELSNKPLSSLDYGESLKKGQEALSGYFEAYGTSTLLNKNVTCEYSVSGVEMKVPGTEHVIPLRGIIDKIEFTKPDPFDPQKVHVVDYKTAKPKSRNEIEGKTKTGSGDYKRQLVFYKLLLDHDTKKGESLYEAVTGEIDFIEPDEKGKYRKEVFEITDADVAELKETISETLKKIYDFGFFEDDCDEEKCEGCRLANLIRGK